MLPFLLPLAGLQLFSAADPASPEAPSLKDAATGKFKMGVAMDEAQILGTDRVGDALIEQQFNSISPENCLKWEAVHPERDRYDFAVPDRYVQFGVDHHMYVIGHALMWHNQVPAWVFEGPDGKPATREQLLRTLREHIRTVVGRYKGRIDGWDVVNEAINEKGELRTDKPWYSILGKDGIFAAFEAAHEADPKAALFYNEYELTNPAKRAGVLELVKEIRARGLKLDEVGLQEHYSIDYPSVAAIDDEIRSFVQSGFNVMITELDLSMLPRPPEFFGPDIKKTIERTAELDPYASGLPRDKQELLARRYADIFAVYCRYAGSVRRVTFWGLTDKGSWLNSFPVRGRTDYPMLFDRSYNPKLAFYSVVGALQAPVAR
jgi:endo-1,4-beta-xylanase